MKKNSKKIGDSFPRALREKPFDTAWEISRGAKYRVVPITGRRTGVGVLLGFLFFSAWNFLALRTLLGLVEWNLSVFRCAGVALLASFWLVITYSLLNVRSR